MKPHDRITRRPRRRGLTLVELLVVILILGILAGVLGVAVVAVFAGGKKTEAEGTIKLLKGAIESFETHNRAIPGSSIRALAQMVGQGESGADDPNPSNRGIEALVYALRGTSLIGGKLLSDDDFNRLRGNTDSDGGAEIIVVNFLNMEGNPLLAWELLDPWGNPYAYVSFEDERWVALDALMPIVLGDGTTVEIALETLRQKLLDPATGVSRAKSYALWSFGPDGVNDYGRGDDIVSWVKIEE